MKGRQAAWFQSLLVLASYLLLSALLTWPVVTRPGSVLFGDYGDTRGWVAWISTKSRGFLDGPANPLLAAPFGAPNANVVRHPITEASALALARILGDIAAANILVVLAFALTAWATYFCLDRLVGNPSAAWLGGFAFGFCPAAVMQAAGGHVFYALNMFLPLFVLALFYNRDMRTLLSALLVAAAYAGVIFTAIYAGYFALFVALFFVTFEVCTRDRESTGVIARNYAWCAGLAALIVIPVEYAAIHEQLMSSPETLSRVGHTRDFGQLATFSAVPWNYLVPSMDHPVLGLLFDEYVRNRLGGSNAFEQTLYLGAVPLGLLLAGTVIAAHGRFDPRHRRLFFFFALAAFFMYLISLPPVIAEGLPTVSYFAHDIFPMFRVYARAGIVVGLLVACAAAVVLAHLCARLSSARYRALLALLAAVLAFEYWSVPPSHALAVDVPPAVYTWLAEQPGDFIVAEYPMARFDEAAFYSYPFWQRIHGKRLVNGATPDNAPGWEAYERIVDLGHPDTPRVLRSLGVKYVVVHRKGYAEGPIPAPLKRYYSPGRAIAGYNGGVPPTIPSGLKLERTFGSDLVFALEQEPP